MKDEPWRNIAFWVMNNASFAQNLIDNLAVHVSLTAPCSCAATSAALCFAHHHPFTIEITFSKQMWAILKVRLTQW
jgi:hypothetical protein